MAVNKKKTLRLKNNTKYFNRSTSRSYVRFSSPYTYQSRKIKIEGYEARLYWQYRYCEEHDGQTFFYTLTYNDNAMPHYAGINCFDYEDLRDLLTGGFRKYLLRHYGTSFRYFIGAELGDGKGERGLHNNPHYHILFFLEPANNERYPYEKITPEDFRHLIRRYWQGFDESEDEKNGVFHDYREAKYGIACEGENCGLVTDYRACCYCAKYVTKDVKLKKAEKVVESYSRFSHKDYKGSCQSYEDFFKDYLKPVYNDRREEGYDVPWYEIVRKVLGEKWYEFEDSIGIAPIEEGKPTDILCMIKRLGLYEVYSAFCRRKIDILVQDDIVTYRNRYCNKCRISQKVGDYALEFIDDMSNPTVQVPSKKGFKNRPLPLYLYRKLFTQIVNVDEVSRSGRLVRRHSPIRVLNELGVQYKLSKLPEQLKKKTEEAKNNFETIVDDEVLFERMRESDINTTVYEHFNDFKFMINRYLYIDNEQLNNNIEEIFKRYAEYKVIYEDRFFEFHPDRGDNDSGFPVIDLFSDYERFIRPSVFTTSRSDLRLDMFLESDCKGYLSYGEHPYFLRYIGFFNILDMCTDYWFIASDDKQQKEAEDIAAVKRFHDRAKLKEFYANFTNC